MPLYARHGVPYCWLVDPDAKTLEAFALKEENWQSLGLFSGSDRASIPPFDAIILDLGELWP